jgi:hypothetical protein
MNELEPLKTKICKACHIQRTVKHFVKTKAFADGYESRCNICKKNGIKIVFENSGKWSKKNKKIRNSEYILPFTNPLKRDYVEAYIFLREMGYSLDQDIHIQFCKKHNLEPIVRQKKSISQYSPKDCDLV